MVPVTAAGRGRASCSSTPPPAPAACPSTSREADVYYFAPQKCFAADGGLWLALMSPEAHERIERDWQAPRTAGSPSPCPSRRRSTTRARTRPTTRPPSRRCSCSPTRSTGCSPTAASTGCVERTHASPRGHLYAWAEAAAFATPFVTDPAKRSLVVGTIDFDDDVDAAAVAATLRANGIVDTEPYRKLGRNQLRIGMFPAIEPDDVQALTACIDWVVEQLSMTRVLVAEKIGASGVELLKEHFDVDTASRDKSTSSRIGDYDGILIRSATKLTADLIEQGHEPEGDRPRRRRRRQRRRPRRDQARHRRRQRAAVQRRHRRRAHDGAAARAGPQRPAGARGADRRQVGALEVLRRRAATTRRSASSASAASASSSPSARRASACT